MNFKELIYLEGSCPLDEFFNSNPEYWSEESDKYYSNYLVYVHESKSEFIPPKNGEVWLVNFTDFKRHKIRPALFLDNENMPSVFLIIGSCDHSDVWDTYRENILLYHNEITSLNNKSFVQTNQFRVIGEDAIPIYKFGNVTKEDYELVNRIIIETKMLGFKNKDKFEYMKEIYNSLPYEDKRLLGTRFIDSPYSVYRTIYFDGRGNAIGYIELINGGRLPNGLKGELVCSLAIKKEFRRRGYAKRALKNAFNWYLKSKFTMFTYRVFKNNIGSIKTAESLGLDKYPDYRVARDIRDKEFVYYHDKKHKIRFSKECFNLRTLNSLSYYD